MIECIITLVVSATLAVTPSQADRILPPWNAQSANTVRIAIDDGSVLSLVEK